MRFLLYWAENLTFPDCLYHNELSVVPLRFQLDIRASGKLFAPLFWHRWRAVMRMIEDGHVPIGWIVISIWVSAPNSFLVFHPPCLYKSLETINEKCWTRASKQHHCIIPSRRETSFHLSIGSPIANHKASFWIRRNKTNKFLTWDFLRERLLFWDPPMTSLSYHNRR